MNKFNIVTSALVVALVCVGLASATHGSRSEESQESGNQCNLRQVPDDLLIEEVSRRGHLRRPKHGGKPLRPRLGLGAGAGAGIGVHANRDRFGASGSSDRQSSHGSFEGGHSSLQSSRVSGEAEGNSSDFDDVQGVSKHTEQSSTSGGLFNKGKSQSSSDIDGFRRTKGHNRGGRIRGESNREDSQNSWGRIEGGQESDRRHGAFGGSSSSFDAGAGAGVGVEAEANIGEQ